MSEWRPSLDASDLDYVKELIDAMNTIHRNRSFLSITEFNVLSDADIIGYITSSENAKGETYFYFVPGDAYKEDE